MEIKGDFVIGTYLVGHLLKEIRKGKNMTQQEFSVYLGISRSYLGDIENGRKSISFKMFYLVMNKLGYTITIKPNEVTD